MIDERDDISIMFMGAAFVAYKYLQDDYVWIYFAYSPTRKLTYKLIKEFELRNKSAIIEFATSGSNGFKHHSHKVTDQIYRWERLDNGRSK